MTLWLLLVIISGSPAIADQYQTEDQCLYAMSMATGDTYGVACQSIRLKEREH